MSTDYATRSLHAIIRRHCSIQRDGLIALIMSDAAKHKYGSALDQILSEEHRLQRRSPDNAFDSAALVLLVAADSSDVRRQYATLRRRQREDIPLIMCMPERPIAIAKPKLEHSGVHYSGLMALAGMYLETVRPRKSAFCEFGTWDGRSFATAYHALSNVCGQFYAFDSFQGIGGTLDEEQTHFGDGQYSASLSTFEYNMRYSGVDMTRVKITKGFFEDSLTRDAPDTGPVAIAHIDVDVYAPALSALNFLTPHLCQGALLLFDDFDHFAASNEMGERRALREWLATNPEVEVEPYRAYGHTSRSFLVHKLRR